MRSTLRTLCVLGVLLAACHPSERLVERERPEIERVLADYAGRLAEAYRTGDSQGLAEVATAREVARVGAQIRSLVAEGKELRATLRVQAVESLDLYKANAATVQTVETWSLKVLARGSESVLSESPEQENRVVYSLTREEGRWRILSRILKQTNEP